MSLRCDIHAMPPGRGGLWLKRALLLLGAMAPLLALAQELDNERGGIRILDASLNHIEQQWQLNASADIVLSPEIRQGLDSGVPLQFVVDVRITQPRRFWYDKVLLSDERRYSLTYYELTRHYRLQSVDTRESRNYRSLLPALSALGDLRDVALSAGSTGESLQITNVANEQPPLNGRVRIKLDGKTLPLPLQPLLSSEWRLASEEFVWPLN